MNPEPRRVRQFVTIAEASAHLCIHERTAYRMVEEQRFPAKAIRVGGRIRIPVNELEAFSGQRVECAYVRPMTLTKAS